MKSPEHQQSQNSDNSQTQQLDPNKQQQQQKPYYVSGAPDRGRSPPGPEKQRYRRDSPNRPPYDDRRFPPPSQSGGNPNRPPYYSQGPPPGSRSSPYPPPPQGYGGYDDRRYPPPPQQSRGGIDPRDAYYYRDPAARDPYYARENYGAGVPPPRGVGVEYRNSGPYREDRRENMNQNNNRQQQQQSYQRNTSTGVPPSSSSVTTITNSNENKRSSSVEPQVAATASTSTSAAKGTLIENDSQQQTQSLSQTQSQSQNEISKTESSGDVEMKSEHQQTQENQQQTEQELKPINENLDTTNAIGSEEKQQQIEHHQDLQTDSGFQPNPEDHEMQENEGNIGEIDQHENDIAQQQQQQQPSISHQPHHLRVIKDWRSMADRNLGGVMLHGLLLSVPISEELAGRELFAAVAKIAQARKPPQVRRSKRVHSEVDSETIEQQQPKIESERQHHHDEQQEHHAHSNEDGVEIHHRDHLDNEEHQHHGHQHEPPQAQQQQQQQQELEEEEDMNEQHQEEEEEEEDQERAEDLQNDPTQGRSLEQLQRETVSIHSPAVRNSSGGIPKSIISRQSSHDDSNVNNNNNNNGLIRPTLSSSSFVSNSGGIGASSSSENVIGFECIVCNTSAFLPSFVQSLEHLALKNLASSKQISHCCDSCLQSKVI